MPITLGRREFIRHGLLAGLSAFAGCGYKANSPLLRATPETLPKQLVRSLPAPWRFKPLDLWSGREPFLSAIETGSDLLALSDGWLLDLPLNALKPIQFEGFNRKLDSQAKTFLSSIAPEMVPLLLPIGVSPWVMLFRKGDYWLQQAQESWDVLLDPGLRGQVVLPASPRLIMSLADSIKDFESLRRLRSQALAFDDRNGINWLLNGLAKVVVLPLNRCFSSLRQDHRLSVIQPKSGSPLNWTILVRSAFTREPLPQAWLEKSWNLPLLGQLLSTGWIPSLPHDELRKGLALIPKEYHSIVLPPSNVWARCWSVPPLGATSQQALEERWRESIP